MNKLKLVAKTLLVSLMVLWSFEASAQIEKEINLNVKNYFLQQGLPSNNINFTFQDYKGFIWIGTWTGLSKFNGYQFINFNPNPNDSTSFAVGQFNSYTKISDSIYLLTTRLDGILKLNVNTNEISRIRNSPKSANNITSDTDGTYWIGTLADGFYHYHPHKNKFYHYLFKKLTNNFSTDWDNNTVKTILVDTFNDSLIWLGCRTGLYKFNKYTHKLTTYRAYHKFPMQNFALNHINSLVMDSKGVIWAGKFFAGIGKLDPKTGEWQHYFSNPVAFNLKVLNTNIVTNLKFVDSQTLSISTSAGPMYFDLNRKTFTKVNLVNNGIPTKGDLIDWMIDRDGNQWFSNIFQNGLMVAFKRLNSTTKISLPQQKFQPDYYESVILDLYWSNNYRQYFLANSNHDGLLIYNKNFDLINQITLPSNWKDKEPFATSLAEDDNGIIWISDVTNQLIQYNPKTQKAENYFFDSFKYCSKVLCGTNNAVFFKTEKGLYQYQSKQLELIIADSSLDIVSNLSQNALYWVKDLDVYSTNLSSKKTNFLFKLPKFATTQQNYIQSIFADSKNRLWIPLEFGGVYQYDLSKKSLKLLSFQDGLNNNTTREIKSDKTGRLFLICNGGLFYFDEKKARFIDFDNLTHQKTNDWYEHCLFFSEDDELIVSKNDAIFLIDKNTVLEEKNRNPIITDFYSQETHYVSDLEQIIVPNNQNDVKIFFSNFDFSSPQEIIYEYKINELSKDFTRLEKGVNQVSLANLKAGNYNFQVRVLGTKQVSECKFSITTIWYKSNLFYGILIALIISITLVVLYYFSNKKNQEKELQKRIAELKLIVLKSQLNPHFLFNCLTSISALIKLKEYNKAEKILNDFAKLMRGILSSSSKDLITLEEEIKISKLYLEIEKVRKSDGFDFTLNINEEVNFQQLVPPLMLQPFLENSIKHGFVDKTIQDKGIIELEFYKEKANLIVKIRDNGIGINTQKIDPNLKNHASMGINIQKERMLQYAQTHNLIISLNAKQLGDMGTEVVIMVC